MVRMTTAPFSAEISYEMGIVDEIEQFLVQRFFGAEVPALDRLLRRNPEPNFDLV